MELFKILGTIAIDGVEKASDGLDKVSSAAKKVGDKLVGAGEKVEKVGKKMTTAITVPLATLGTLSTKTAASFEDGMLKVQSLSGATDEEFQQLTETAKQFGASTAWSASQVADAMGYMALAGFDTNDILESTSGMLSLASASGEDLATVTDILTDSMTAFGDGADQASRYADVLATTQAKSNTTVGLLGEAFKYAAPLAGTYKYKLEDVSTALGMMANAGVKGSMAGTSLSSIITRLGTDTDGCRETIEELGVNFYNADGTARGLSDVLMDLADKTNGMSVAEKSAIAKTVAGQEAQKGLLAILNQGSDAYATLQDKIENCNGAAEKMATNMESGLGGSIRSLKSALEGAAITLGNKLAPYIEAGAEKIKQLCTWFENLDSGTQDLIVKIGLLAAAAGPVLLVVGKVITTVGKVIAVGGKIAAFLPKILALIGGISAPVLGVIAVIGGLIAIGVALYKNWDTIKEKAHELSEKLSEKWNSIKEKNRETWDGVKEKTQEAWGTVKETMSSALESARVYAFSKLDAIRQKYEENGGGMKGIAAATMEGIKQYYSIGYDTINKLTGGKLGEVASAAQEKMSSMRSNVQESLENIRLAFVSKLNAAKAVVTSIFEAIRNTIHDKIEAAKNTVRDGVQKLKEFFNFTWELPKIKLPHFKISGKFSLNPPSVPHFGIDWYKKAMNNPMLMTQPTAFGINNLGQVMAGGEAGAEVVSGANTLMNMISDAVESKNAELISVLNLILKAIYSMDDGIGEKLYNAMLGMKLQINEREFGRLVRAVD